MTLTKMLINSRYYGNPRQAIWPYLVIVYSWMLLIAFFPRPWRHQQLSSQYTVHTPMLVSVDEAIDENLEDHAGGTHHRLPIGLQQPIAFRFAGFQNSESPGRPPFQFASKKNPISEKAVELLIGEGEEPGDVNPKPRAEESKQLRLSPLDLDQVRSALPENEKLEPISQSKDKLVCWVESTSLIDQLRRLKTLSNDSQIQQWIDDAITQIEQLKTMSVDDVNAAQPIAQLLRFAKMDIACEPATQDILAASEIRRAAYALLRRSEIWKGIVELSSVEGIDRPKSINLHQIHSKLDQIEEYLNRVDVDGQWMQYLRIARVREIANSPLGVEPSMRRDTARKILGRLNGHHLSESQKRFLSKPPFQQLRQELNEWAYEPVDFADFLASIENFELSRQQSAALHLARQSQNLRWCGCQTANLLADKMELYYRNANVRLTVTGKLMEYLLPILSPINESVSDNVMGASVSGRNSTWTQLGVRLIPDDNRLSFRLIAQGRTESKTVSTKGPVRVLSHGNSRFAAGKDVLVDRGGLRVRQAQARVNGRNNLINIETDYDQIPILGWVLRLMVKEEHEENRGQLRAHVQNKISKSAEDRLNAAVGSRLEEAQEKVSDLLKPLQRLDLELKAIEMRTTPNNVVVRCRLAGSGQLAAYTPRPRALRGSLMSLQMHQSTINNLLQQVDLDNRNFELEQLISALQKRLGINREDIHQDIPEGVSVTLSQGQPIVFEFDRDRVLVTVKIAELSTPRRKWRNFVVRARYRANLGRTHVDLERDGGVELISKKLGFRDQIALRGIFIKVLSKNHRFQILRGRFIDDRRLASLGVTQFMARDGWIGISVGKRKTDRVARTDEIAK